MGVQGLWDLLSPVGRRVSVETLAGKKLAIDASIWIIQFMKAMRDEKGEMVRNAHILGFFRRICKLLYLRTKPVFVFDGGTPALKRRTVIARRRQRENAQAKIRKTAEKLLLNHLKAMRLKELAADLENQRKQNDTKGKKVISEATETVPNTPAESGLTKNYDQEAMDEMLAASLVAEEDWNFAGDASTSRPGDRSENGDTDEDEEMILPELHGKVDPSVLAALPPSMQLDLLVQMRERLMAENRQKYQRVKKAPEKFSELQIQAYLKTVAFRREIDVVRKSSSGRGIGGVQTSRIASEANREFIFSSSFTGNKDVLASAGEDLNSKNQKETPKASNLTNATNDAATRRSSTMLESIVSETGGPFHDDVETYLDERGNVRVSRLRAMGIRMTRDLQRNLDLMKEVEEECMSNNKDVSDVPTVSNATIHSQENVSDRIQHENSGDLGGDGKGCPNKKLEESVLQCGNLIQISFDDNVEHNHGDDDDDLFAHLVAGDPVIDVGHSPSKNQFLDSGSEVEWEEGVIEDKGQIVSNNSQGEGRMNDDIEVEWEEESLDIGPGGSSCPLDSRSASKGALEEEANFQEAIIRSLGDLRDHTSIDKSHENEIPKEAMEIVNESISIEPDQEYNVPKLNFPAHEPPQQKERTLEIQTTDRHNVMQIAERENYLSTQLDERLQGTLGHEDLQNEIVDRNLCCEPGAELTIPLDIKGVHMIKKMIADTTSEVSRDISSTSGITSVVESTVNNFSDERHFDAQHNEFGAASAHHVYETRELAGAFADIYNVQKLNEEGACDSLLMRRKDPLQILDSTDSKKDQVEFTKASLEEEMHVLDEEREKLGDEQRKLERNAESVSSEMFVECQELLQMFGLPYIVAPMEAEAQCAYMELANLVDGVVTDDSDAFIFGARSVYKNIFDDRKYVETYFMKDVENELGLDREKLIRMTLLLGSDYTEGVSGIGIVNAIEVLNAFPEEDGLQKFRDWVESPDPTILGELNAQAGSSSRKRGSRGAADMNGSNSNLEDINVSNETVLESEDESHKMKKIFMEKHRNVSKNWHIPLSFPSDAVISAYASPRVDKSTETFSWGKPDVSALRKVCWEKFGWSSQKADELLIPVLKEFNKHETQLRLEAFYSFNERFAKIRSKRITKAVKCMTGNKSMGSIDESVLDAPGSSHKRGVKSSDMEEEKIEDASIGLESAGAHDEEIKTTKRSTGKQSRKRKGEIIHTGVVGRENTSKKSSRRETAGSVGKTRRKNNGGSRSSETSLEGEVNSDIQTLRLGKENQVRRSERHRKVVNYIDTAGDDFDKADQEYVESITEKLEGRESGADPAIAEGSLLNSTNMNDEDVNDDPCRPAVTNDYLETGGGVHTDGTEMKSFVLPSFGDDLVHADLSSTEYLKTGGGFCLEEDDADTEHGTSATSPVVSLEHSAQFIEDDDNCGSGLNQSICSPTRELCKKQRAMTLDASSSEPNLSDATRNSCHKVSTLQENLEDDSISSAKFLRAMPNLRRRRKRC